MRHSDNEVEKQKPGESAYAWKIADVPERWRAEVQELLDGNTTA